MGYCGLYILTRSWHAVAHTCEVEEAAWYDMARVGGHGLGNANMQRVTY
jgi:hypothetical protein